MSGETLTTIVAIFLAAILIGVFPMMSIADRNDDISQLAVQNVAAKFVDKVRKTGKITEDDYNALVTELYATGNTYEVELEVEILDENPTKKTAQSGNARYGENVYYSEYTSKILDFLEKDGVYVLKEGDKITCTVKNTNNTIAQSLKNFFYSLGGNNTYSITATQSGMVVANGS